MKRALVLLLPTLPLCCQTFSYGVKGGLPLTEALSLGDNPGSVDTHRWTVGPTVELGLGANVSIGLDVLYRSYSFSYQPPGAIGENSRSGHWEVPLYLKRRFGKRTLKPFVEVGVAFDRARTTGTSGCMGAVCPAFVVAGEGPFGSSQWGLGTLAGGGVEVKALRVGIEPEIRYTRWQSGAFSSGSASSGSPIGGGPVLPGAPPTGEPNQVEVLVGIRF
jgi:hypothetical protein